MPKPEGRRPYRRISEPGEERVVVHAAPDGRTTRYTLRQIGWHGQTGAFYELGESPARYEPGSFSPMWVIAFADALDDEGSPQQVARQLNFAMGRKPTARQVLINSLRQDDFFAQDPAHRVGWLADRLLLALDEAGLEIVAKDEPGVGDV
ncbi:hypothetical protein [Streptosporangium jomthongense]|uniref:Uncharacterized protein n=1 Tax=Streptosporangium jomthongense TaxID=1193683 RepID=A0ABV8FDQ9_9ACTN